MLTCEGKRGWFFCCLCKVVVGFGRTRRGADIARRVLLSGRLDMRDAACLPDGCFPRVGHARFCGGRDCIGNPVAAPARYPLILTVEDDNKIDAMAGSACGVEETFFSPMARRPTCPGRPRPGPTLVSTRRAPPGKMYRERGQLPTKSPSGNAWQPGRRAGLCGCVCVC